MKGSFRSRAFWMVSSTPEDSAARLRRQENVAGVLVISCFMQCSWLGEVALEVAAEQGCCITSTQCESNNSNSPPPGRGARPLLAPAFVILASAQVTGARVHETDAARGGRCTVSTVAPQPARSITAVNQAERP